nr:exo-alpha-sialidase [Pseudomonas resinovorans]
MLRFEPSGGGWHLARQDFLGEPVSMLLADPRDGHLYAALHLGHFGPKLWRSADAGASWEEIPAPAFPPVAEGEEGPSVEMIWCLEPGGADQPGTLWAGTISGGLFRSRDRGDSWQLVDSLWQRPERANWLGGGYDQPGIHSICVDPRDSRRLTLAVSCGGVWHSEDEGASWNHRTHGMYAAYMPPERAEEPDIQDPHRMVACPADPERLWVQHHNGIFVSADRGLNWREIPRAGPSTFGFAVAVHPTDPDCAWFVPAVKDECRVPADQRLRVTRTRDGGQSFDVLERGLPQQLCYDLVYRHGLDVDGSGQYLVMGSTTGHLWVSEDAGDSWELVAGNLPPIFAVRFG